MPDQINEAFAARHFLNAVGISTESLKQRDKPDFVFQDGGQTIGLEVCDATPEEYQRVTKVLHNRQWEGWRFTGNLQYREEKRSTSEVITETMKPNIQWQDNDDIHDRWRMGIKHRLLEKERAFTNGGFTRFDQNWLLIYDLNVALLSHVIDIPLIEVNLRMLGSSFAPADYFDKVWIDLGGSGIVEWRIPEGVIAWNRSPTG